MEPTVKIMVAYVVDDQNTTLATVERVTIGGGARIVGHLDGQPVERADPTFERFHARFLSPDRMISDQLVETETYDEAIDLAMEYGRKRLKHAEQVADLAETLKMD